VLKVTWRNLVARKVRLLLSAFAIVLGVAFVAGSLVFTDALGGAFDDIIEGSTADVEVAYKGANSFDAVQDNRTIPASVVGDLEQLPEAAGVHPVTALQTVYVIGTDGKVVGGNGPPGLAFSPTTGESVTGKPILTLVDGELPGGPREIALDVDTAERAGYDVGDTVELVTPGTPPRLTAELTGLVEFGSGGLNGGRDRAEALAVAARLGGRWRLSVSSSPRPGRSWRPPRSALPRGKPGCCSGMSWISPRGGCWRARRWRCRRRPSGGSATSWPGASPASRSPT
jgi:hypothetical protein